MRRVLRWLLILGALAGVIYAGSTYKIGRRTAFGHVGHWVSTSRPWVVATKWIDDQWDAMFASDDDDAAPAKKKPAKPKPKKPVAKDKTERAARTDVEAEATPKRVALLESAAREASRDVAEPRAARTAVEASPRSRASTEKVTTAEKPKKTKVDERLSAADKKALDELVTSRVAPR
ncbi:hypothetical protein L6R52_00795 [Myxococcota bacterium]|nr:hypothetical protein [Myxococcota bacterium]